MRGSVEQVQVTGAKPGAKLILKRHGDGVGLQRAGALGGAVFRRVAPGGGYRVAGKRVRVLPNRSAPPSTKGYAQRIPTSGYGYLSTRDGTTLAIDVRLPSGPGPYPTLVEYSGYGYADPDGGQSSISQIANLLGYAVVDVNMRGTGCSGGAFDYFEPLQGLDGYDVVETVARQPWVKGKPGMIGVSYGGISQLFVAATKPPSLAAIAPLSVIDNTATTLYPGGILNTGFALSWAKDRVHDAKPASATGGQPWALKRIREGDKTCKANQALHPEAVDLLAKIERNRYYVPEVADPLAPVTFVHRIRVPTFLACQWTDEQTGGHCPTLASRFTGTSRKWFTFTNGTHTDSLDPATFNRWFDFLELYVAGRAPRLPPGTAALAPLIYQTLLGVDGVGLPPDPIQAAPTLAAAQTAFEAQPRVRILFENGAVSTGKPGAGFERSYPRWPAARHRGALVLPRGGRDARRRAATRRAGPVHVEPARAARDRLLRRHRRGPERALDGDALLRLAPEPGRHRAVVHDRPAGRRHDGRRRGRAPRLGPRDGARRRPPGHDHGGPARREGDLRPGRLAARERPQARRGQEHAARAGAQPARARPQAAPAREARARRRPALLPGPRLPGGLADPRDRLGARRRPAGLGVRPDASAERHADGPARPRREPSLAADPAGRAGRPGADAAAAVPRPARGALPLAADDEHRQLGVVGEPRGD